MPNPYHPQPQMGRFQAPPCWLSSPHLGHSRVSAMWPPLPRLQEQKRGLPHSPPLPAQLSQSQPRAFQAGWGLQEARGVAAWEGMTAIIRKRSAPLLPPSGLTMW